MALAASSDGRTATLAWTIQSSGLPTGGTIVWTTGDGASGSVHDGFADGAYAGDANGTDTLSDGRPFSWTRTGPSPVVVSVSYDYLADGIFPVEWSDCCPEASGGADLVVSLDGRPQQLAAARGAGAGEIVLAWREPSQTGLTGYRLLRGPSPADLAAVEDFAAGAESRVVGGLADGTRYFFALRSLLGTTEAGTSDVADAVTPSVATAPREAAARSGPARGQIELSWKAPTDDGGRPITAYRVYQGHHPSHLHLLAEVDALAHVDSPLPDGVTRYYRVAAVNDRGEGPTGNLAGAATFPPTASPAPLPTPRAWTAAAHAGVAAHIFGGLAEDGSALAGILAFDPYANTMTALSAQLPGARQGAGATWVPGGHAPGQVAPNYCDPVCNRGISLVAGGAAGRLTGQSVPLSDPGLEVLVFDPDAEAVTQVATLPSSRSNVAVAYAAGTVVVAGGLPTGCSGCALDEILEIDVETYAVSLTARLPAAGEGVAAASDGSVVYLLGGRGPSGPSDRILAYDPTTDTVTDTLSRLPSPRSHGTAVWVDDAVLLLGGSLAGGPTDEIVRFDPASGEVTVSGRLPSARCCGSGVYDGQNAYVFGGETAEGSTSEVVRHRPGQPVGVVASAGPDFGQITVRWLPPVSGAAGALTGYRVYRGVPGGDVSLLAEVGPAANRWTDGGHPHGATFVYRVSAVTETDEGPHSAAATATTWLATGPGAVRNLTWRYSLGFAEVSWNVPADNGAPPPTGYFVVRYRMDHVSGDYHQDAEYDVGNRTSFEDSVRLTTLYRWVVWAYNPVGRGPSVVTGDLPENALPVLPGNLIP